MLMVMKCIRCNNEMMVADQISTSGGAARILKIEDFRGDRIIPFCCSNCGYIELYNEKFLKE